nr:hypothetical protein [Shewanella shenzhenensis]
GRDYSDEIVKIYQQEYSLKLLNRKLLICGVRVQGVGATNILQPHELTPVSTKPVPESSCRIYFSYGWQETPLYKLQNL